MTSSDAHELTGWFVVDVDLALQESSTPQIPADFAIRQAFYYVKCRRVVAIVRKTSSTVGTCDVYPQCEYRVFQCLVVRA